jgi:hypothetical protein
VLTKIRRSGVTIFTSPACKRHRGKSVIPDGPSTKRKEKSQTTQTGVAYAYNILDPKHTFQQNLIRLFNLTRTLGEINVLPAAGRQTGHGLLFLFVLIF